MNRPNESSILIVCNAHTHMPVSYHTIPSETSQPKTFTYFGLNDEGRKQSCKNTSHSEMGSVIGVQIKLNSTVFCAHDMRPRINWNIEGIYIGY